MDADRQIIREWILLRQSGSDPPTHRTASSDKLRIDTNEFDLFAFIRSQSDEALPLRCGWFHAWRSRIYSRFKGYLRQSVFICGWFGLRSLQLFFQIKRGIIFYVVRIHQNAVDRLFFVLSGLVGLEVLIGLFHS